MLLAVFAFCALLGFWLLLSGHFVNFLILAGIASSAAVVWFAQRMEVVDREGVPAHSWRVAVTYWPWLAWEIIKAAWVVSKIILHPRLPISPTLVRFKPSQHSSVALVTHANSITLTPGTITVQASAQAFLVHGLTKAGAEACIGSEMDRRLGELEQT